MLLWRLNRRWRRPELGCTMGFREIGVEPRLVEALRRQGIKEPFEVQTESIPFALDGLDVCCRAPTGSGKTLAFGLPLISRCRYAEPYRPTALILSPTRELAEQICGVLKPLAATIELEILAVYGGTSYSRQRRALKNGVDILVACPGRLMDLVEQDALELSDVDIVVIDEADRMADMGFIKPVSKIIDMCSEYRQTILFSATLDDEVAGLVSRYQTKPVNVEVGPKAVSMDSMNHFFWEMKNSKKSDISSKAIKKIGKSIIFCRTRAGVDRVGYELEDLRLNVTTLHGGMTQSQRDKSMKRFSKDSGIVLVATDVAARGIDIQGIKCVIHYDPPENGKAYKHRSGRTARARENGTVISLVQRPQKRSYNQIQKNVGIRIDFTQPEIEKLPNTGFDYSEFLQRHGNSMGNQSSNGSRNRRRGNHRNRNRGSRNGRSGRGNSSSQNGSRRRNNHSSRNGRTSQNGKPKSRGRRNARRNRPPKQRN